MKCPRCVQRIHRAAEVCPHCGFSLADADGVLGGEGLRLRALSDRAGILRRGERERVEAAMERLGRRLPQVFAAVYTGALGEVANIRQFGFWLLNRAVFEDVPAEKSPQAGVLVTVDPESKAAAITFGYLLDPYLEEADTFECLARGHAYWLEERYADGLVRVLHHLEKVLCKRSRQVARHPEAYHRKVQPLALVAESVRSAMAVRAGASDHDEEVPR